jgi:tRNA A-37 threonylcarbamoyl transferase component Bud32
MSAGPASPPVQLRGPESVGSTSLPPDLVAQAVVRMRRLALVTSFLMLFDAVAHAAVLGLIEGIPHSPLSFLGRVVCSAYGLAVGLAARSPRLSARTKTDLGLSYEVLGGLALMVSELAVLKEVALPFSLLPSVCIWMLVWRFMVPVDGLRAGVTLLLTALTVPVAAWLTEGAPGEPMDPTILLVETKAALVTAVLAWFASRSLYRLGREVSAARALGAYTLEEKLGEGGMGEVWRARHRALKRPAAIKRVRPEALGRDLEGARARFEREARATARLQSVHSVQLFDFGVSDDGAFYYAMELLDGLDLGAVVERWGPLPPARAVRVLAQVCHALVDAHAIGLIHRDIKPQNVLLCRLGPDLDFVKVVDFGLARDLGEDALERYATREGQTPGTPAFMAPELALGDDAIGPAADIYMVGTLGYWLLSGRLVFEAPTAMAMVAAHLHAAPPRLSTRTELEIPEGLDALLHRCLAKDPTERPASAAELRAALLALDVGGGWTDEEAARWWARHRPREGPRASGPLSLG